MSRLLRFLPLLVLVAFVGAVAWRLSRPADEEIPLATGRPARSRVCPGPDRAGQAGLASSRV